MVEPSEAGQEHWVVRHVPYISAVGDDVLMLRDGDVMASLLVEGIAASTAETAAIDDMADAVAGVVAQATPDIAYYVHRVSTAGYPDIGRPVTHPPFAAEIDQRWFGHLRDGGLRTRYTMITLVVRPQRLASVWSRMTGGSVAEQRGQRARRIDRLEQTLATLAQAISAARPTRLTIHDGHWLGLLGSMITGSFQPIRPTTAFVPIADLVSTSRVAFRDDTILVFGQSNESMRYGAILSVKQYPALTRPGMYDRFDLPFDMVITQSYTPTEPIEAQGRIRRTARQMGAADDAAISLQQQLIEAGDDLASGRISFGTHHCTVAVFTKTRPALESAVALIARSGQEDGGVFVREDIGARTAYFAQHPGNAAYRARAAMISSRNFAGMTALHGAPHGASAATAPWGEAVTVWPTLSESGYRFNFHLPGAPGERTIGHTLVLGHTGSGKTLGMAFLIAQAQRLSARVIVFDKDQGLEMPVRALGGVYSAVKMGVPAAFNPFRTEADERGTAWLADWICALLGDLSALQIQAIATAAKANRDAVPALQTLSHFRRQFRSVDDDGDLHTRLGRWDVDGQYGWLFGGSETDSLNLENDVTGFDLTEIFDAPAIRTAWLSYVFRRIERVVDDERPTLVVLDEAWKLLDDPYFEGRLKDWMLTMRKKNVAVVLLTQRLSHVVDSKAGGAIIEGTATTLLFPHSRNTRSELAALNLTDSELAFATSSSAGQRLALVRSGADSVIINMDLSALGALLRVLGGGKGGADPGWRSRPDFWRDHS